MAATQADVDAAVSARNDIVTRGAASYNIEGITYTALDLDKLDRLIAKLRLEVAGASAAGRHSLVVEFGRPD